METKSAENTKAKPKMDDLSLSDLKIVSQNARKLLGPSIDDLIKGEDLYLLAANAEKILGKRKKTKRRLVAVALASAAVGLAAITASPEPAGSVAYDPSKVFIAESTPSTSPFPTESSTPKPTIEPKAAAEKEIGNKNFAEYFLGDLVKQLREKRQERYNTDPDFAKRIQKEFLNSDQINMLYLGVDETRERPDSFTGDGIGRSDSIMLISFNIKTFKTVITSLPRDLYAPELKPYFDDPKINTITMVNQVPQGRGVQTNELAKKLIEDATGIPVDMIIRTNIDFMQGAKDMPGIFDELFPDGLEIDVPYDLYDPDYPVGYGTKELIFHKGKQKMKGYELAEYGRTRHSDNDFGRTQRQRQIAQAGLMNLFPRILNDVLKGDTTTLDRIAQSLEKQKAEGNLFYDTDIIEIIKTMRVGLANLSNDPKGIAALGRLGANSKDNVISFVGNKNGMFVSFGLGYGDTNYSLTNAGYGSTLKLAGSDIASSPLLYWDPLRKHLIELM